MSARWRHGLTWLGALLLVVVAVMGVAVAAPGDGKRQRRADRHRALTEGIDCSACHTPHGWKQLGEGAGSGGFDHARTGFPLTGQHVRTACIDCHAKGVPKKRI